MTDTKPNENDAAQATPAPAPAPAAPEDDLEGLPPETQEEIKLGKERVALYANANLPVQELHLTEAPGITTEEPGEFIEQESAASPVGTEPNPPEGVTALSHTPIERGDPETEGLDAKERKQLYEAHTSRGPNDVRPAVEIANEIQERKDKEAEARQQAKATAPAAQKKPLADRIAESRKAPAK